MSNNGTRKYSKLNVRMAAMAILAAVTISSVAHAQSNARLPDWKSQFDFPHDYLLSGKTSYRSPRWIKFTVLLSDPGTVYFQNMSRYHLHYDFATECLVPFIGMSRSEYDQVTLYEQGQQAVLGTVIIRPESTHGVYEYGIHLVRQDPYPKEMIRDLFNLVTANVLADQAVQAFYFPSYEQVDAAEADREWLESNGVPVSSSERWAEGNTHYSEGWALGMLKYFPGDEIPAAFHAGDLAPGDILLTDGVPAEIPSVAGILTLSPSTPNSHVAILAQTFDVPFVHLALPETAEEAQSLTGHRIVLRAYENEGGHCDVDLIDVESELTDQQISEILALKSPPALDIMPTERYGAYSAPTAGLSPSDIRYFGGKAANMGILRTAIPVNSPISTAFSFDLWHDFLDQPFPGGGTFREQIAARLAGQTYPPSDMAALLDTLAGIRDLFKDHEVIHFSTELENAIVDTLTDPQYGFDMNRKIRFRSSTNVEDSAQFTGAGLYDSFSGCLADDLDGDDEGPSLCDPTRPDERGVFRAIRKVFASFYNDNAYLERLRHGVNEDDVGMALLVHHSFPDEIELANGVATLEDREDDKLTMMVSQAGAVSVANPEGGIIAEEVRVRITDTGHDYVDLQRSSNLLILGEKVLDWEDDYLDLAGLLIAAADEFESVTGKAGGYVLDFEYKKVAPNGDLVVKQIREIPQPDTTSTVTPFLLNEPTEYRAVGRGGGRGINIFTYHRLKSLWRFETKSQWLTEANMEQSFYEDAAVEYAAGGHIFTRTGPLSSWPNASHTYVEDETTDTWTFDHLPNHTTYRLVTELPTAVNSAECPILIPEDFGRSRRYWPLRRGSVSMEAEHAHSVPVWGDPVVAESIDLYSWSKPWPLDELVERTFEGANGITVTTSYKPVPVWAAGIVVGCGYASASSVETTIQGYTSEPIVLRGYFSQTHFEGYHMCGGTFLFEPRLEPGISAKTLAELRAQNIRLIVPGGTYGFDEWDEWEPCDVNFDGNTDAADIQLVINSALHIDIGDLDADVNGDGAVNAIDVQHSINTVLGIGPSWSILPG